MPICVTRNNISSPCWHDSREKDKTADFDIETRPPFSKMRQTFRICKGAKTADFVNERKLPIFQIETNCHQNCLSDESVSLLFDN